jgi:hypothetical protein
MSQDRAISAWRPEEAIRRAAPNLYDLTTLLLTQRRTVRGETLRMSAPPRPCNISRLRPIRALIVAQRARIAEGRLPGRTLGAVGHGPASTGQCSLSIATAPVSDRIRDLHRTQKTAISSSRPFLRGT